MAAELPGAGPKCPDKTANVTTVHWLKMFKDIGVRRMGCGERNISVSAMHHSHSVSAVVVTLSVSYQLER
jgi:hypothetical protein